MFVCRKWHAALKIGWLSKALFWPTMSLHQGLRKKGLITFVKQGTGAEQIDTMDT